MPKPTSKEEIVNLALGHLKIDAITSIDPPDEDSKAAAAGAKWYDQARRTTLEDHPWKFAAKRAQITAEAAAPLFEYAVKYELPNDFIRVNRLGQDWDAPEQDYEIESGYILCDVTSPLDLVYVWDLKDVSKFSPKFITCLSYCLAKFMAYEMTGNASLVAALDDQYIKSLSSAAAVSGQNRPTRRVQRSRLSEARQVGRRMDWRSWGNN
jgi:hypothetical protein